MAHPTRGNFALSPAESDALIRHTLEIRDRIILELMLFSGLRRMEVKTLQISNLDLTRGEINFQGKGGRSRLVPMPPFLISHLREFTRGRRTGPVFQSHTFAEAAKGYGLSNEGIAYVVMAAGRRAGLKPRGPGLRNLNPHTLRHTFARRMKDAGMPWEDLALLLGHTDVKTTLQIYGTRDYEEVKTAYLKAVTDLEF